jgi:hypothetical protein
MGEYDKNGLVPHPFQGHDDMSKVGFVIKRRIYLYIAVAGERCDGLTA